MTIQNTLVWLQPMDGVYTGPVPGHGAFFEWSATSPQLALYNNVFRADQPSNDGDEHMAPPPGRIEMRAVVRHCAVEASIPVLSARLVFVNAAVCTPLTVCVVPACARQDPGGGGGGGGGDGGEVETPSF